MTLKLLLLIGAGGFLGSIARFASTFWIMQKWPQLFPMGTFFVNVLGAFLIGVIYGYTDRSGVPINELRFFLATGFCGGFTTFSTFSYENIDLLQQGNYLTFLLYALGSLLFGLIATYIGALLTQ